MIELKERHCSTLSEGDKPLGNETINTLLKHLSTDWQVIDKTKLGREFLFESYLRAMAFVQEIALIAEKENHHPNICIYYTKVVVELTTHDVKGLSDNDFIMAAKIEEL